MSNIFEDKGLVLYCGDFMETFNILKKLYDEHGELYILTDIRGNDKDGLMELGEETYFFMTEILHEASIIYSPKEAKFDILEIYNYGNDGKFALLGNINENMLLIIAYLIIWCSDEIFFIFSNEPKQEWLHDYIGAINKTPDPNQYCIVTLYYWHTIVQQFHFCLFNMLPDWDWSSNLLIVSKDQKLFNKFMYNKNRKYSWKKLKMSMFPMNN